MKKFLVLAIALLLVSGCGKKSILEEKGYNEYEIALIENLGEDAVITLEELPYYANIEELISAEGFLSSSLADYITIDQSLSVDDCIMIVNKGYFTDSYSEETLALMKTPFYVHSRLERYLNYLEGDNYRQTVELVNADADLKPYEEYQDSNLEDGYLVLCNKYNSLGEWAPDDCVDIESRYGLSSTLRYDAYEAFKDMADDMADLGLDIWITSAYRSYDKQESNYNYYLSLGDSVTEVDSYCARPGFSEHQTGLVVDVIKPGGDLGDFQYTEEYQWMKDHAHEYGFILRYPEDKEPVTGYVFESWHYRYVGEDVAKYIYEQNITLDEYHAYFIEK